MDFFPNYTDSSGGELLNSFEGNFRRLFLSFALVTFSFFLAENPGESSIGDLLDDFYDEDDDDFLDFAMEDDNNNFTDTIGNLSLFFKEIPTNDTLETVMFDFHSILGDFGGKDEQNADDVEPILVPSKSLTTFIVFYSLIAAIGIIGNSTLLMAIVCSPRMRSTARNTFIAVLGLSDLTQCFVTVPLKLWYLMSREWPFGDRYEWLCKVAHSSLMMPLFLSSLAIVAIAYDRFRCINQSHRSPLSPRASGALSLIMVIAAVLLSTPLFVTAHLGNVLVLPDGNFLNMGNVTVCENSWEGGSMKYYMIAVSTVQYAVPILIVLFVYVSIHRRLRNRPRGNPRNEKRRSRASTLMAAITFVFFISWLPYNIFHLMMVTTPGYFQSAFQGNEDKVYALLHFFGFSNAWINPLLYGYLNENIRREYKKIYR